MKKKKLQKQTHSKKILDVSEKKAKTQEQTKRITPTTKFDYKVIYKKWSYVWGALGPLLALSFYFIDYQPQITIYPLNNDGMFGKFRPSFSVNNQSKYKLTNIDISSKIEYVFLENKHFKPDTLIYTTNLDSTVNIVSNDSYFLVLDMNDSLIKHLDVNLNDIRGLSFIVEMKFNAPFPYFLYHKIRRAFLLFLSEDDKTYCYSASI